MAKANTKSKPDLLNSADCPECGAEITLGEEELIEGTEVECPECQAELCVDTLRPLVLLAMEEGGEGDEGDDEDDEGDEEDDDDLDSLEDDDDEDEDDDETE